MHATFTLVEKIQVRVVDLRQEKLPAVLYQCLDEANEVGRRMFLQRARHNLILLLGGHLRSCEKVPQRHVGAYRRGQLLEQVSPPGSIICTKGELQERFRVVSRNRRVAHQDLCVDCSDTVDRNSSTIWRLASESKLRRTTLPAPAIAISTASRRSCTMARCFSSSISCLARSRSSSC